MLDADARDRNSAATRSFDMGTSADKPVITPHAICDLMLRVLSRDNESRGIYVRRRWQGLAGPSLLTQQSCDRNRK